MTADAGPTDHDSPAPEAGPDTGSDTGLEAVPARAERVFPVAFARGVNPGKWARIWAERHPELPLELIRTDRADQLEMLADGRAQLSLAREPFDHEGLHVIGLYEEVPVVVLPADHALAEADGLTVDDLRDEQLLLEPLVVGWAERAAELGFEPAAAPITDDPGQAIEAVAAGAGAVVVPQSVARLHDRSDVRYVKIGDLPLVPIALAWPRGRDSEEIQDFVGIARGRTANSSRRSGDAGDADSSAPDAPGSEGDGPSSEPQNRSERRAAKSDGPRRTGPAQGGKGTPSGTSRGAQLAARRAKSQGGGGARGKGKSSGRGR